MLLSSPRKRGCFLRARAGSGPEQVFPAQAGVFPPRSPRACSPSSLPRASGGVSGRGRDSHPLEESSPRKRGCFPTSSGGSTFGQVFPAQAGVFPFGCASRHARFSLPRASGGVSLWPPGNGPPFSVFPAQAGVFLTEVSKGDAPARLPRASGGVSAGQLAIGEEVKSSPRKRGCFYD